MVEAGGNWRTLRDGRYGGQRERDEEADDDPQGCVCLQLQATGAYIVR